MNGAHLHLLLNHVPVIGTIGVTLVLAAGGFRRDPAVVRLGLWLGVLVAVGGVVVYLTGEPAEEVVEHLAGVDRKLVHAHEEAAELATVLQGLFGLLAAFGLWRYRGRQVPHGFVTAALVASLVPAAAMGYAGNLGGQIRHPEARPGFVAPAEEEHGER